MKNRRFVWKKNPATGNWLLTNVQGFCCVFYFGKWNIDTQTGRWIAHSHGYESAASAKRAAEKMWEKIGEKS